MNCNQASQTKPKLMVRLAFWLFPYRHCPDPETVPSLKWSDMVITRVEARFSFIDRLRILVSGRVHLETRTATQNEPGYVKSVSQASVLPPTLATFTADR